MKYFKWLSFDSILMVFLLVVLILEGVRFLNFEINSTLLIVVAIIGTLPVAWSALKGDPISDIDLETEFKI